MADSQNRNKHRPTVKRVIIRQQLSVLRVNIVTFEQNRQECAKPHFINFLQNGQFCTFRTFSTLETGLLAGRNASFYHFWQECAELTPTNCPGKRTQRGDDTSSRVRKTQRGGDTLFPGTLVGDVLPPATRTVWYMPPCYPHSVVHPCSWDLPGVKLLKDCSWDSSPGCKTC